MTDQVHFLTAEEKKKLEEKLAFYKSDKRKEVTNMISAAREYGDLSENSEYDAAKERQAILEREISEMEDILLNCKVVSSTPASKNEIAIGSTVTLYDEEFDEEVTYKILGSTGSDPANGIISNLSPVGSALMGKKKGDVVSVNLPTGNIKYKVLAIN